MIEAKELRLTNLVKVNITENINIEYYKHI